VKVLLTGASGFVGRALCPVLKAGYETRAAYRQLDQARSDVEAVHVGDIDGDTDWRAALTGCESVVHLAGRVHVMHESKEDPAAVLGVYRANNTLGTLNLARQAAAAGVRRFVFASTIKVNGEGRDQPYTEADAPSPLDAYAISKWEAEQGLWEIAAQTGMQVVILRFPLVYGPGVGANFLRLVQTVERGVPLPFGRIKNRRSLIYLGNLVDAIGTCLAHPAAANKTFLVSDGDDVSTPVLIRGLATALGRPSRLLPVPVSWLKLVGALTGKKIEMDRLLGSLSVDSSTIRKELQWSPPFAMNFGLKETAKWYRDQRTKGLS
jgi:nucleoside-diphosphate-sugar epimerase